MAPLSHVRVLDLSRLLPGPYASLLLADLGADVVKIEDPAGGDYARYSPPMQGDKSALFEGLNRNKKSLCLDLKQAADVATFKSLVREADVVLEGFRPGVMSKLGLSFATLQAENPRIIVCSISGFGQTGPDARRAVHDLNSLGRAGLLEHCATGEGVDLRPAVFPGQVADIGSALFAALRISAALYQRQQSGVGCYLDVSMLDSATAFHHLHLSSRWLTKAGGTSAQSGKGLLEGGAACYNVYACRDGKRLSVASLEPHFLVRLCEAVGLPALSSTAYALGSEGQQSIDALAAVFAQKDRDQWLSILQPLDVCVDPVNEGDEVFEDRQLMHRALFQREPAAHLRTPVWSEDVPYHQPPSLGEHTEQLLAAEKTRRR
jgi:alpha-methylacyl-CoA racemase